MMYAIVVHGNLAAPQNKITTLTAANVKHAIVAPTASPSVPNADLSPNWKALEAQVTELGKELVDATVAQLEDALLPAAAAEYLHTNYPHPSDLLVPPVTTDTDNNDDSAAAAAVNSSDILDNANAKNVVRVKRPQDDAPPRITDVDSLPIAEPSYVVQVPLEVATHQSCLFIGSTERVENQAQFDLRAMAVIELVYRTLTDETNTSPVAWQPYQEEVHRVRRELLDSAGRADSVRMSKDLAELLTTVPVQSLDTYRTSLQQNTAVPVVWGGNQYVLCYANAAATQIDLIRWNTHKGMFGFNQWVEIDLLAYWEIVRPNVRAPLAFKLNGATSADANKHLVPPLS